MPYPNHRFRRWRLAGVKRKPQVTGFPRRRQRKIGNDSVELTATFPLERLFLGHANIGITARHYLDKKGRTTVGLGLLPAADKVIQIPPDDTGYPSLAVPQS
jgi:hypothetical protein